jgi:hypothetical protein
MNVTQFTLKARKSIRMAFSRPVLAAQPVLARRKESVAAMPR